MMRINGREMFHDSLGAHAYFQATCEKHKKSFRFAISVIEMVSYRGSVQELLEVTARHVADEKCDGCHEAKIALPEPHAPAGKNENDEEPC